MKYTERTLASHVSLLLLLLLLVLLVAFDVTVELSAVAQVAQPDVGGHWKVLLRFSLIIGVMRHIPIGRSAVSQ